jgi:hypothetical protein
LEIVFMKRFSIGRRQALLVLGMVLSIAGATPAAADEGSEKTAAPAASANRYVKSGVVVDF